MLRQRLYIRYQEWKYGIHTEALITQSDLGFETSECHEYVGSNWKYFKQALDSLEIDYRSHVFVDCGAGMGRALILASGRPFKRVIGVEVSAELARVAERNIRRARSRLVATDVRIINVNARDLVIAPDMSVFYFYNPFHGQTLEKVLSSISDSVAATPRPVRLICQFPSGSEFESQIQRTSWLQERKQLRFGDAGTKWVIFRHDPSGSGKCGTSTWPEQRGCRRVPVTEDAGDRSCF
jgi:16S rRNA G966 N2-methylase RsmD